MPELNDDTLVEIFLQLQTSSDYEKFSMIGKKCFNLVLTYFICPKIILDKDEVKFVDTNGATKSLNYNSILLIYIVRQCMKNEMIEVLVKNVKDPYKLGLFDILLTDKLKKLIISKRLNMNSAATISKITTIDTEITYQSHNFVDFLTYKVKDSTLNLPLNWYHLSKKRKIYPQLIHVSKVVINSSEFQFYKLTEVGIVQFLELIKQSFENLKEISATFKDCQPWTPATIKGFQTIGSSNFSKIFNKSDLIGRIEFISFFPASEFSRLNISFCGIQRIGNAFVKEIKLSKVCSIYLKVEAIAVTENINMDFSSDDDEANWSDENDY